MYTIIKIFTGMVIAMTMVTTSLASPSEWELKKDKKNIKVYTKKTDNSDYYSFKATSLIKTNTQSLVNLMRDMSVMDNWLETCRDPIVVSEPDDASRVIHMKNDSPFFLISDRDLVLLQRFHRVSDEVVMVDLIDHGNDIEEADGHVRATFNGHWMFTKISDTEVEVEYFGLTDPKGSVPSSMSNLVVLDVPFNTLRKIRKILHDNKTQYDSPIAIDSL
jgi:hypothetical protein